MPGGYIGVDIFFVISGYLISSILLREMQTNSFTFIGFYERRARRILPALFAVLLATIPFAWTYLFPEAFEEYAGSMASTSLFASNVFFWSIDSYDAQIQALKPLLHTWSLAVEEQFYVLFPILLLLAVKFVRRYLLIIMATGFVISLAIADWGSIQYQDAGFFLIHTRGWELLGGAILAKLEQDYGRKNHSTLEAILPAVGLILVLHSFVTFNEEIPHPSLMTLSPVLGAMLIIWFAGPRDLVTRILASRAFVAVGLISYSLYLWHQPAFVFARIIKGEEPSQTEIYGLILLSILLGFLSYKFIEKPTRNRSRTSNTTIWAISILGTCFFLVFGYSGYVSQGFPDRVSNVIKNITDASYPHGKNLKLGNLACIRFDSEKPYCKFTGGNPAGFGIITVGDSHMRTLHQPIVDNLGDYSGFMPLTSPGCLFVLGLDRVSRTRAHECTAAYNQTRLDEILGYPNQVVIMGGRLPLQIESAGFDNREGGREENPKEPRLVKPGNSWEQQEAFTNIQESFVKTANALLENGVKVVVVYPVPEVGINVPKTLGKRVRGKSPDRAQEIISARPVTTSYQVFKERTERSYRIYDAIPDHTNLIRIYPEKIFCREDRCITHAGDEIYYRDDDHLSYVGASLVVNEIMTEIHARWGGK